MTITVILTPSVKISINYHFEGSSYVRY